MLTINFKNNIVGANDKHACVKLSFFKLNIILRFSKPRKNTKSKKIK